MTDRELTLTPAVLRELEQDATRFAVLLRAAIVVAAIGLVAVGIVCAALASQMDPRLAIAAIGFVAVLYPALHLATTRRTISRSIAAQYPVGSTLSVVAGAEGLHLASARTTADIAYSAFRSIHEVRSAVLLRYRGSSLFVAVPRETLSEDELKLLRAKIGAAGLTPP